MKSLGLEPTSSAVRGKNNNSTGQYIKTILFLFRMDANFVKLTVRAQYKFKASNNDEVSWD